MFGFGGCRVGEQQLAELLIVHDGARSRQLCVEMPWALELLNGPAQSQRFHKIDVGENPNLLQPEQGGTLQTRPTVPIASIRCVASPGGAPNAARSGSAPPIKHDAVQCCVPSLLWSSPFTEASRRVAKPTPSTSLFSFDEQALFITLVLFSSFFLSLFLSPFLPFFLSFSWIQTRTKISMRPH